MIKVETNMGNLKCDAKGNIAILCADTAQILHGIYECIADKDERAGEVYRETMERDLIMTAFHPEEVKRKLRENLSEITPESLKDVLGDLVKGLASIIEDADDSKDEEEDVCDD